MLSFFWTLVWEGLSLSPFWTDLSEEDQRLLVKRLALPLFERWVANNGLSLN